MLRKILLTGFLASLAVAATGYPAFALPPTKSTASVATPEDYLLLTVFLKHDQSKTLDQIQQQLQTTGFWSAFPPPGIEVESWYVMMGIGQVVTLRVPPQRLREVNLAIEKHAWGAFRTEFYPTYDFRQIAEQLHKQHAGRP